MTAHPPAEIPELDHARAERTLRALTEAVAVSGDEAAVRSLVLTALREHGWTWEVDTLGNVIAHRAGSAHPDDAPRVLLAAHMDEVGLMLLPGDEDGWYRVRPVGGLSPQAVLGQAFWIGPDRVLGVIGLPPVHLHKGKAAYPSWDELRLDVGPRPQGTVAAGMRAAFATPFRREGDAVFAKALDDRVGVALLLMLLAHVPEHLDVWFAFTVQEEVGLRGARVVAHRLAPDVALAVDCTPARDIPGPRGEPNPRYNVRVGQGPALYLADRLTISDPRLLAHAQRAAARYGIPYQFRQAGQGATDAGAMHAQRGGIASLSISVPARGLHGPIARMQWTDWAHTWRLLWAFLHTLTPDVLEAP